MSLRGEYTLLLTVLIISVIADAAFGQNVTSRSIQRCNKVDYTGYNKRCCQQPIIDTYDSSAVAAVCNNGQPIDPKYFALFKDYTINKYQSCGNDYKINWNSSRVVNDLGPCVCLGSCAFDFLHLLNSDGSVNDVALSLLVPTLSPLPWKLIVLEAVTKCKEPVLLLKDVKLTMVDALTGASKTCAVTPYVYVQCVMGYVIGRCPTALQVPSPPATCADDIVNIDKCTAIFNLPPLTG